MSDLILPDDVRRELKDQYSISRSVTNQLTGTGGPNDLVNNTSIKAPRRMGHGFLESIYIESWAAAKVVDLIVDDVFAPGIVWNEEDPASEKLVEHLALMKFWQRLMGAVKAGRLYGSALLIACPYDEEAFYEELIPEQVRPGDITNLVVVDKDRLRVDEVYDNPSMPNYGEPYSYVWNYTPTGRAVEGEPSASGYQKKVHASRCFKFDGIEPITTEGWQQSNVERWWGYSVLQRVIDDLLQDVVMSSSGSDAVRRNGMPVVQINRLREMLSKGPSGGGITPQQYADEMASNMDFRKILFLDTNDKVDKLEVNNSGIKELIESQVDRLAMIAGVPVSRFTGESASGLSATGKGDARDWRTTVEAYRGRVLDPHIERMLLIMARNAGIQVVPDWEWGRLGEMSVQEEVDVLKGAADAVQKLVLAGVVDENEAREILSNLPQIDLDEAYVMRDVKEDIQDEGLDR